MARDIQLIMPADNWSLGVIEGVSVDGETAGLLRAHIAGLIRGKPFDLSGDYMLRADLI